MIVEKQTHLIPKLTLLSGHVLEHVKMGYETYGELNAAKDNAILIVHHFSGTSHAAGRYTDGDPEPGYWNSVIGPGKAIDTARFFVVSCDTLCNINTNNPTVITTGPMSINPATGQIYGPDFPVVTIGDFVNAQNHLAESLGIESWYAVAGPSMGGMQTLEWAARYPEKTPRAIVCVAPGLSVEPYVIAKLSCWCAPLMLDAKFNGGHYTKEDPPIAGLKASLKLITLDALHWGYAHRLFGRRHAERDANPALDLNAIYAVDSALDSTATLRARVADANSILRIARAVQTFSVEERKEQIRARVLYLPARSDLLMPPALSERAVDELRRLGRQAELFVIEGDGGHLDGLNQIGLASDAIRNFLEN